MLELEREMQREGELMQKEREIRARDRELAERYHREQQAQQHPVQSHTGSIPIHQPVASKVPSTIHGPNGLLSNLGANSVSSAPQSSVQASSQPGGLFGNQIHPADGQHRQFLPPSQPVLALGSAPSQIPGSVAALAQGQQPILNVSFFSLFVIAGKFHLK